VALRNQAGSSSTSRAGTVTDPTYLGPRSPKPFVGASKCAECHAKESESWQKTGHAKAFVDLSKDNRQTDAECLSCHTTGFKVKGGFTSESATAHLKDVQCEACHGPGVMHSRRPQKGYGAVSEMTCLQCHDPANSPKFEYKTYLGKVVHTSPEPAK